MTSIRPYPPIRLLWYLKWTGSFTDIRSSSWVLFKKIYTVCFEPLCAGTSTSTVPSIITSSWKVIMLLINMRIFSHRVYLSKSLQIFNLIWIDIHCLIHIEPESNIARSIQPCFAMKILSFYEPIQFSVRVLNVIHIMLI